MKFILIDSDYDYNSSNEPVIRLFGKKIGGSEDGVDIAVHVLRFEPYFYVEDCGMDIKILAGEIVKIFKGYIKRIEIVKRFKPIGYQENKTEMLKIVVFNPRTVPDVRKMMVENIEDVTQNKIHEADILFRDRFMIDMGIDGMSVIEFNEVGKELSNYGIGCNKLYICEMSDLRVINEIVKIEY